MIDNLVHLQKFSALNNYYVCLYPITDCPEEVSSFLATPGLIVRGGVAPPIEGVTITVHTDEDGMVSTTTNARGKYE